MGPQRFPFRASPREPPMSPSPMRAVCTARYLPALEDGPAQIELAEEVDRGAQDTPQDASTSKAIQQDDHDEQGGPVVLPAGHPDHGRAGEDAQEDAEAVQGGQGNEVEDGKDDIVEDSIEK